MLRRRRPIARVLVATLVVLLLQEGPARSGRSGVALAADQPAFNDPLVIVVNRSNPVNDLSFDELRRIFLGNRSHWPNGRRITLVMREPGEQERRTVLHEICGMNEDQFKNHFLHGLYTGEILVSPKILSSPTGVRKFIFNVPGAIGYLRIGDVDETVKVLRIDELLPEDKGYKLHVPTEPSSGN
jgi:ABC-type phosphate transport system substrate-binding protein